LIEHIGQIEVFRLIYARITVLTNIYEMKHTDIKHTLLNTQGLILFHFLAQRQLFLWDTWPVSVIRRDKRLRWSRKVDECWHLVGSGKCDAWVSQLAG